MTLSEMYEAAYDKEYAGVFAWSDRANDGHGTFDSIKVATNAFYSNHADIVDGLPTQINHYSNEDPKSFYNFSIVNKSGKIILKANKSLPINEDIHLTFYNVQGKEIFKSIYSFQKPQNFLVLNGLYHQRAANGIYILNVMVYGTEYTNKLPLSLF
jgi:hypothetical protein